jgi:hypothetical protein
MAAGIRSGAPFSEFSISARIAYIPEMNAEFEWEPEKAASIFRSTGCLSLKRQPSSLTHSQSRCLTHCIPDRRIASSLQACLTSNGIWWWCIRSTMIEYD